MVKAEFHLHFEKAFDKIRDRGVQERILKLLEKIREMPDIGKPMSFQRKGTREVYVPPFRLSYAYFPEEQKVIFLDLYHKDEQ